MQGTQHRIGTVITWQDKYKNNFMGRIVGYTQNNDPMSFVAHSDYIVKTLENQEFVLSIDDPTIKRYMPGIREDK